MATPTLLSKTTCRLLDLHEAAAQLRVSTRTLWNMARVDQSIAYVRVGKRRVMFEQRDIDEYLARQRQPAAV
jgi:excisionase family DNA binding protein